MFPGISNSRSIVNLLTDKRCFKKYIFYADDFWLGLKKIHSFTQQGVYILRIDLEDWKEGKHWAEYRFSLEGSSRGYGLHVSHFSGDLPDALANRTGMRFSTKDRNNDNHRNSNCARTYTGTERFEAGCIHRWTNGFP